MGLIDGIAGLLFGGGRNVVAETVEVFRPRAEAEAARDLVRAQAALAQFGAEFAQPKIGWFDQVIDGMNRVPRPLLALGTVGLFISAMVDPVWFASRMQGIALVPEPLWWLMGAIVSFYFGSRYQAKGQEFQRSIAQTMARTGEVGANLAALAALQAGFGQPDVASDGRGDELAVNQAMEDWRREQSRAAFAAADRAGEDRPDPDERGGTDRTASRTGGGSGDRHAR